jgi:hypothetical protein
MARVDHSGAADRPEGIQTPWSGHFRRAIVPAIAGSLAAGLSWWTIAELPEGSRWTFRGLGWFVQSLYLLLMTTSLPNIVGLTLLSRWLMRDPRTTVSAALIRAVVIGIAYGGAILVVGVIVGLAIVLLPTMVLMPRTAVLGPTGAVPGLIRAVLLVRELYAVAAIGGIVSVTGLLWNTREA